MKKMDKLVNKMKDISFYKDKIFWICMLISSLFFGALIIPEYSTDTYAILGNEWTFGSEHFASLGRFVTAAFWTILIGMFKLRFALAYIISWGIGIICFATAIYKLYYIIKENISNKLVAGLVSILIIVNIFSLELFMYFEKGILALSVLLNVLAVEQLIKAFNGNKKSFINVFIYMIIANCCYQGTVALFVALAVIYIAKYAKNIVDFIKKNILVALLYAIPALMNYLIVKFAFESDRVSGQGALFESISLLMSSLKKVFINSFGIIPAGMFIFVFIAFTVIYIYSCWQNKENGNIFAYNVFKYFYVTIAVIFATVAPQLLQDTVYMAPRDTYTLASLLGIIVLLAYTILQKDNKIIDYAVIAITVIFIFVQYYNFMCITMDHYTMNKIDKSVARQIDANIKEYEQKSGNKVTKVIYYQDKTSICQYPELRVLGDANIKANSTSWSRNNIILVMTGRNLEEILEQNQEYAESFKKEDWDYFNAKEQLIFDGDTVHICCY